MSSKKRKASRQRGTHKLNQYQDGSVSVSVNVHAGRVTGKLEGPIADNVDLATELFRARVKSFGI